MATVEFKHCSVTWTQFLVPQNQGSTFFNGDSLSLTLTFALRRGLSSMTTLITTGALPFSNKVYSTRTSTSWHMALDANRPDGARQNSLDWQLFLCPAVQQMGRWATKWTSWHQINLFLFLCYLNVRAMKLTSDVVSKRGKGLHNCSKSEPTSPPYCAVGKKWFRGEMSGFHPRSVIDMLCKQGFLSWILWAQLSYL